jgi:hypothetical protein
MAVGVAYSDLMTTHNNKCSINSSTLSSLFLYFCLYLSSQPAQTRLQTQAESKRERNIYERTSKDVPNIVKLSSSPAANMKKKPGCQGNVKISKFINNSISKFISVLLDAERGCLLAAPVRPPECPYEQDLLGLFIINEEDEWMIALEFRVVEDVP